MTKHVTLDEVEEYERELRRAHAENRAPALKDPYTVNADEMGNVETNIVFLSEGEQKKADADLKKERADAAKEDEAIQKRMRDTVQRTELAGGTILPYQAPDPARFQEPKTKEEKEYADKQIAAEIKVGREMHGSFNTLPPNTTKDGLVTGDSINPKLTRKETSFNEHELALEEVANQVPAADRYHDNRDVDAKPDYAAPTGNTIEKARLQVLKYEAIEDVLEDQIVENNDNKPKLTVKKTTSK